jgi:hypothetical protein
MQVINNTNLPIFLNDLTSKQEWKVEYGKDFKLPNELARFIFLHEFSHLLDYLRGLNLYFKQTKANRFALANWKR